MKMILPRPLRYLSAFGRGIVTGADPIGCALGYLKVGKPEYYPGYWFDRYPDADFLGDKSSLPQERGLDEIVFKAAGDAVGLSVNVMSFGGFQLGCSVFWLAGYCDDRWPVMLKKSATES